MSSPYSSPDTDQQTAGTAPAVVLRMQIITIALVMGPLIFLGIALALNSGALGFQPDFLSWSGIGIGLLVFAVHLLVPNVIAGKALRNIDTNELGNSSDEGRFNRLATVFLARHIVACALLEGAAFLNLITYLTTEFAGNLALASMLIVCIVLRFPTADRVQFWVQDRMREIELR